ncbi:fibronectin type III domain-containing protein [Candidatus Roizmanbacteria bacterium]|nr:fibronectin type III domain-containing protein [Candidatus Roizmanbacteria bacterium]
MNQHHKLIRMMAVGIGVVMSGVVVFMGFTVAARFFTKASNDAPSDVAITNITQNSVRLTWTTVSETQGVVEYGTSLTALNFFAPEPAASKNHGVDLTLLAKDSTYLFQIRIVDRKYGIGGTNGAGVENGQPWDFKTKSTATTTVSTTPTVNPSPSEAPLSSLSPTPVSSVVIPDAGGSCTFTDCLKICQNKQPAGSCSTQEFQKSGCIGKVRWDTCASL